MYKYAEIYFFNNKKCAQYIETNNIFNLKNISDIGLIFTTSLIILTLSSVRTSQLI